MTSTLRLQLTDDEKREIFERFDSKCFATGHRFEDGQRVEFDHVKALAARGEDALSNIAPMCELHNRQKGTLPLQDFRTKLQLNAFFQLGNRLTLKDLLRDMKDRGDISSFGHPVTVEQADGSVTVQESGGKTNTYNLYADRVTGWHYFYASLPVSLIDSDDDDEEGVGLQPRYLIEDKVFGLYRHFQQHPVLQPSLGRIHKGRIVLFDGQHKIAALLWNGKDLFDAKVYLDADPRLLGDTNIEAHDKYTQSPFYSAVMVEKLGLEFGADFENYRRLEGASKSEANLMGYLREKADPPLTTGELNRRFYSYLYHSVLGHKANKLAALVSPSNRSTSATPLTIDMLTKSVFAHFLYRTPAPNDMASEGYKREAEINNVVALLNDLYELGLFSWNPGARADDDSQRRLRRMFGSKPMMAWSELLHAAVVAKLDIIDPDDKARVFYRDLADEERRRVRFCVQRLVDWAVWDSPPRSEIDDMVGANKSVLKDWLRGKGLTVGYLMGAE